MPSEDILRARERRQQEYQSRLKDTVDGQRVYKGNLQTHAYDLGITPEEASRRLTGQGYYVDPSIIQHATEQSLSNPGAERGGYAPVSNDAWGAWRSKFGDDTPMPETARHAMSSMDIGRAMAGTSNVFQALEGRQGELLSSMEPGLYRRLGDELAAYTDDYAGKMDLGLEELNRYGLGEESLSRMVGDAQTETLRRSLASQLASNIGGYDPALVRSSQYAQAQGQSDIAAKTAIAAAEERQKAMGQYMGALERVGGFRSHGVLSRAALSQTADSMSMGLAMLPEQIAQQQFRNYMSSLSREDDINKTNALLQAQAPADNTIEAIIGAIVGTGSTLSSAMIPYLMQGYGQEY